MKNLTDFRKTVETGVDPRLWFSLDHKWSVSDGVVSGIRMLFSLDHKLYASDYDSRFNSVASENQLDGLSGLSVKFSNSLIIHKENTNSNLCLMSV